LCLYFGLKMIMPVSNYQKDLLNVVQYEQRLPFFF
jgi:hypothetical protein